MDSRWLIAIRSIDNQTGTCHGYLNFWQQFDPKAMGFWQTTQRSRHGASEASTSPCWFSNRACQVKEGRDGEGLTVHVSTVHHCTVLFCITTAGCVSVPFRLVRTRLEGGPGPGWSRRRGGGPWSRAPPGAPRGEGRGSRSF